jgi:hypothetical protein
MKRIWILAIGAAGVVAGAQAMMSACVHDDSTIFVHSVLQPQLVAQGQACVFTSDPGQPFLSSGTLDTALKGEYDAVFLVGNQLVAQGDPTAPKTETSYVNVQGAIVRITDSLGNQLNTYTRLTAALIPPSVGTSPGYTPVGPVTILDPTTVADKIQVPALSVKRVVAFVKIFGVTLGGQSVESNEFQFPIDVCNECLIGFTPTDINPNCAIPNCLGNPSSGMTTPTLSCEIGQDFTVDCQICKAFGVPACDPAVRCIYDGGGGGG